MPESTATENVPSAAVVSVASTVPDGDNTSARTSASAAF